MGTCRRMGMHFLFAEDYHGCHLSGVLTLSFHKIIERYVLYVRTCSIGISFIPMVATAFGFCTFPGNH